MRVGRRATLSLLGGAVWIVGGEKAMRAQEGAAPGSLEAIAVSSTEIRCYWLPAAGATGYRVERDGQTIATLPGGAQQFADTNLAPDSTHHYRVQALQGSALSPARDTTERTFAPFPASPNDRAKSKAQPALSFDLVVVQASSGGVAAAIEAGRRGLNVALIEPTTRVGGMPVNGLSATDLRRPEHANGFFVRFRDRVRDLYAAENVKATGLNYEPRVAHQAMKSLLYETPHITLYRRARLAKVLAHDVLSKDDLSGDALSGSPRASAGLERPAPNSRSASERARRRVDAIVIEELDATGAPPGRQATLHASCFIDATDCGDLAAGAGAPFQLGREPRSPEEPHAGVIYYDRAHDKALPGSTGAGDRRIQAYAYLLTVKDYGAGADKTIPEPPGYRKERFLHAPAWKDSWAVTSGRMPNSKLELNQHPEGGDLQEINYAYPTGDAHERALVEKQYHDHVLGYLYYIQTEQGQKQIGLPDDEYRDTGGFPPLLYVREGRRILGEQLPTETEIAQARRLVRPESIGVGDYPMDSHAVRRKTDWTTPDMGEGEWWLYLYTPWHQLPLGILVPQRLDNVFVTTAVASTHVSFGTYRLEPVRMAFGQAAGIAAALCLQYHLTGREVPARQVQEELLPHPANPLGDPNTMLTYLADVPPGSRHYRAIHALAARGFQFTAEELKPEAPTTRGELAHWLRLLVERAAPPPQAIARYGDIVVVRRAYYPYMGAPADREAVRHLEQTPNPTAPITRMEFARWLTQILAVPAGAGTPPWRCADVSDPADLAVLGRLDALGIEPRIWDSWDAYAPDGALRFQPNAPINHADLFAALFLAQRSLGPLFNDSPVDARNGRAVPSGVFETVTERR